MLKVKFISFGRSPDKFFKKICRGRAFGSRFSGCFISNQSHRFLIPMFQNCEVFPAQPLRAPTMPQSLTRGVKLQFKMLHQHLFIHFIG